MLMPKIKCANCSIEQEAKRGQIIKPGINNFCSRKCFDQYKTRELIIMHAKKKANRPLDYIDRVAAAYCNGNRNRAIAMIRSSAFPYGLFVGRRKK